MPAVICRLVQSKTEYLASEPGTPEKWTGDPKESYKFPTHALADKVAESLRETLKTITDADGHRLYYFVHARTIENHEWDFFGIRGAHSAAQPNPPAPSVDSPDSRPKGGPTPPEFVVHMDPRRLGEIRRDPPDSTE